MPRRALSAAFENSPTATDAEVEAAGGPAEAEAAKLSLAEVKRKNRSRKLRATSTASVSDTGKLWATLKGGRPSTKDEKSLAFVCSASVLPAKEGKEEQRSGGTSQPVVIHI